MQRALSVTSVEAYWAEIEKIAAPRFSTLAATLGAATAAGATYMLNRDNVRQDHLLRAIGHLDKKEHQQRAGRRYLQIFGSGALAAGLAGMGMPQARKRIISSAQKFIDETATPGVEKAVQHAVGRGDDMMRKQVDYAMGQATTGGARTAGSQFGEGFMGKVTPETDALYANLMQRVEKDLPGLASQIADQVVDRAKREAPNLGPLFGEQITKGMKSEARGSVSSRLPGWFPGKSTK